MPLDLDYQRAAEAALAADQAAQSAHSALFDFARALGELASQLQARSAPLPLAVRFVRQPPPRYEATAGVRIEDAPKERPAGFASVLIETRDLFFAIESIPGVAIAAVTNIAALEPYAASVAGIAHDADGAPYIIARDFVAVGAPAIHTAGGLLEAFLAAVAEVFAARAAFNPAPV